MPDIVNQMDEFLKETKQMYDEQISTMEDMEHFNFHVNMPKVSGCLEWAKGLRERVVTHMTNFKKVEHLLVFESDVDYNHWSFL